MHKVNTNKLEEFSWSSPKGEFAGAGKEVSEALGRKPQSTDLMERHPFDVEICRIAPGQTPYPYHSHSAQCEFYHVISGKGVVRHQDGTTVIEAGDAFYLQARRTSSDDQQQYGRPDSLRGGGQSDRRVLPLSRQPEMDGALARSPFDSIRSAGLLRRRRMKAFFRFARGEWFPCADFADLRRP
jgi:uncharacterized cupin superfamily protein